MKFHIFIRDSEAFINHEYNYCFTMRTGREGYANMYPEHPYLCSVEVDVESARVDAIRDAAIMNLDQEIRDTRARLQRQVEELEERKQKLLALPGSIS